MRCTICGGELPPWSRFCSWCGVPAPEAAWGQAAPPGVAEWRQDGGGWILLHVAIGLLGMWAAQLFVLGLALAAADAPLSLRPIHLLPAGTGLAGWFLFVSLRAGLAARLAALVGPLLLGLAVTFALNVRPQG